MSTVRGDLKNNFLRRIILRLDYNGVIDIKETLVELQKFLKSIGFVDMMSGFISEVEFELNDPILIESQSSIPLKELNKIETYKFQTADKNTFLEVNRLFVALSINSENYCVFEDYRDKFIEIIELIGKKNEYLKPTRLGLRKINNCILLNRTKFAEYFNPEYYRDISVSLKKDGFESDTLDSKCIDTVYYKRYMFNYIRCLTQGTLRKDSEEQDVYQVSLDIDGYSNDSEWLKNLNLDKTKFKFALDEINDALFNLYLKTLSKNFISKLSVAENKFEDILGVKSNDCL